MVRICFVCLGNICRSPTAEAVMRHTLDEAGLEHEVLIESAGTGDHHVGAPPDVRATRAAKARGVTLSGRAAHFGREDFARFDLVLAMDRANRDDLLRIAPSDEARQKVHLLREFDPDAPVDAEVPDPYYGGAGGFDTVLELCEAACRGLVAHLRASGAFAEAHR
jgi:protein-tyrosine phosphatase